MKLVELVLRKFFTYDGEAEVAFPEGVTVLVGANGSGKTAAGLEATCWLLWGKTTRGTSPTGDVEGQFRVGDDVYAVERRKGGKEARLTLRDLGLGLGAGPIVDLTGQTATETQKKIESIFGSWERFCAERVFSNRLARRFGSATDKERKALIESILGLERHERAAQAARDELGARKNKLQNARVDLAGARAALAEAERALASVPAGGDPGALRAERAEIAARGDAVQVELGRATQAHEDGAKRARALKTALDQAGATVRALTEQKLRIESQLTRLRERAKTSLEMGDCPVCFTPAKDVPREKMREHFAGEIRPLMTERDGLASKIEAARAEAEEVQVDHAEAVKSTGVLGPALARAQVEARAVLDRMSDVDKRLAAAEQVDARRKDANTAVQLAGGRVAEALGFEEEAEGACLVAEGAVKVLGPRGARVRRMDGALRRLTAGACEILGRMPIDGVGPLRLSIKGSRTQASGKEVDEVSIKVEGAGGGEYDGTSDGERTRLDVAIMLGLARLQGEGEGLIVFDELFDPLDDAGLEAVVEVLGELAARRQVVITTHNPRFLSLLPASACWRVSRDEGGMSRIERQG